jgi:ParB family chromosome partitioning protein
MQGRRRLSGAFFIDITRIRPDPAQPRKNLDTDNHRELSASVLRHGVIQPISVRYLTAQDIYQIISGERRYHASVAAGFAEIPCIVHAPADREVLVRQLVENWQRVDLKPFEIADALHSLKEAEKCTQRELAEMTGKSESEISKLLALLDLAPDVQRTARDDESGRLSRRHLYAVAKVRPEEQQAVLDRVRADKLTADDTEKLVSRAAAPSSMPKRGAPVHRIRLLTPLATVLLTFRRKHVSDEDIVAALEQAKEQVSAKPKPDVNIVIPKYAKKTAA